METLDYLKRKIETAEDLAGIVRTMKVLAAVTIRQYERAVEALVDYNRTVELGLRIVLAQQEAQVGGLRPRKEPKIGAIVIGSDQGLVGRFNDQIVTHALGTLSSKGVPANRRLVTCVGARANTYLEDAGQAVDEMLTLPGSVSGVTGTVAGLLLKVDQWQSEHELEGVVVFYNRRVRGTTSRPTTMPLLPIDRDRLQSLKKEKWPSKAVPTFTMSPEALLSSLARQYLFVSLYRALAESLASENASRLAAMELAEKNIRDMLQELTTQFHQERQTSITAELLDTVAGFEAISTAKVAS